jgi:drug/metabolite transporter (DMT)-like permease
MPVSVLVGWQGVFGAIPVVIGWLLVDPSISLGDVSARAWAGAIYAMLIPMIYCHWAYYKTVMMFPANIAALSTLATPVVGVVSSALLLGEPLGLLEFGSMGLVTLALVIILAPLRSARG